MVGRKCCATTFPRTLQAPPSAMDSRERRERGSWRYKNQIIDSTSRPGRSRSRAQADQPRGKRNNGASREYMEPLIADPFLGIMGKKWEKENCGEASSREVLKKLPPRASVFVTNFK